MRTHWAIAAITVLTLSGVAEAQSPRPDRAALRSAYNDLAASFCLPDVDATIEMKMIADDLARLSNELDARSRTALTSGSEATWRYLSLKSTETKTLATRVETAISQHRTQMASYAALCRVLRAP